MAFDLKKGIKTLNTGRERIMSSLAGQGADHIKVIDIGHEDDRIRTPVNAPISGAFNARCIIKDDIENPIKPIPYAAPVLQNISDAVADADLMIAQASTLPYAAAHAAEIARRHNVHVVTDYDASDLTHIEPMQKLLENSNAILAPHDAVAPPRFKGDNADLVTGLFNNNFKYPAQIIAVSNGIQPIECTYGLKKDTLRFH